MRDLVSRLTRRYTYTGQRRADRLPRTQIDVCAHNLTVCACRPNSSATQPIPQRPEVNR